MDDWFTNHGTSEMRFVAALDHIAGMRSALILQEGVATGAADACYRTIDKHASTHIALDAPRMSDIEGIARPVSHWVRTSPSTATVGKD